MATAYIYNGFGKYETNEKGELGITLSYAAVPFWLPFEKVTPIPDTIFRELDHEKSTAALGEQAVVTYQGWRVPGERIVEELTAPQYPVPNSMMGIIPITGKKTGAFVNVCDGKDIESGQKTYREVALVEATKEEKEKAAHLAKEYKKLVVQEYLQSKREKMITGFGRSVPDPRTRLYMEELGVEDVDDISAHSKHGGINPEMLTMIFQAANEANADAQAKSLMKAVELMRQDIRSERTAAKVTRLEREKEEATT